MKTRPEKYYAYLLRLWLVEQNGKWAWRVSLENIHTHERLGFASMEALIAFLKKMEKTGRQEVHSDQID